LFFLSGTVIRLGLPVPPPEAAANPAGGPTALEPFRPYHGNNQINKKKNRDSRCNVDHCLNSPALYFLAPFHEHENDPHARYAQEKHSRQPDC
jgi:hypothetical protein